MPPTKHGTSLLREIQAAAVDSSSDLETLLRKCRVLASRLQNDDFKQWVQSELDGYREGVDVPEYRRLRCPSYGYFSGPFGRQLKNAPIPDSYIPKDLRKQLSEVQLRGGVSELADLVRDCKSGVLTMNWPSDAYPLFGDKIYVGMNLLQAEISIAKSSVVGVLSAVRNRTLDFALEIESTNPDAGEAPPDATPPISRERVSQIFSHCVFGDAGSVASGHHISQTTQQNIKRADFESLALFLKRVGLAQGEISELKEAIAVETKSTKEGLGPRVTDWIGKAAGKVAQGTMKVTTAVATTLLSEAIKSYYRP